MSPLNAALKYVAGSEETRFRILPVWWLREDGKTCACPNGPKKGKDRCKTPGKHPIIKAWQKVATDSPERIKKMFAKYPKAYVGIMPPPGHSIIDVDPRNGGKETFKALRNGAALPETVIQRSGGGGIHLFFKGEPTGSLGKGIDTKRNGRGYVVAWPSPHESGGEYTWKKGRAPWECKFAPLPLWLSGGKREAAASVEQPLPGIAVEVMREALTYINPDNYNRWIDIGQALRHAYGDAGEELWVEWSRTSSKFQEGDEGKWQTFDHNRDRPLITIRSIISIARRGGYRPLAKEFLQGLWSLGEISDGYDNKPDPILWAFQNCIPGGKVTLLAGAGGSSKSMLTLTLAVQNAIQEPLGPFVPGDAGKALLIVAEEDRADIARRVHAIRCANTFSDMQGRLIKDRVGVVSVRGLDWRLLCRDEAGNLQETDRVDYLIDEVNALGDVRFLVLDPLVAFNGANENDNAEMARLMFTFDRIAEKTGAAVVVVHHVNKGGQITSLNEATQAVIRGASALVDNARSAILLTRMPRGDAPLYGLKAEDAGRFVVCRFVKNNYGPYMPDTVFAVGEGGTLRHAPEVQKVFRSPGQAIREMQNEESGMQVLRAMIEHPGASQESLAGILDLSESQIGRRRAQLEHDGYLHKSGKGTAAKYQVTEKGRKHADA